MRAKVEVKILRRVLKIFEKVAGKSAPVLLKADPYAKRLEIIGGAEGKWKGSSRYPAFALSVGIDARVDEAGKTAVIIEYFRNALKGRSGEVEILDDAERIVLRGHFSDFVGKTNPEEIPTPEVPVGTVKVSVPAQELAEGIELCLPSVYKKGHLLSGINFEPLGLEERLRLVASDGHVLSLTEIPWSAGKDSDFGPIIVPWKICEIIRELIRLFHESVAVLGCFRGEKPRDDLFTAESVDWKLTAKPVEGVYPDISRLVPLEGLRVVVSAEEFEGALKPFAKSKPGRVIAEMFSDGNALVFAPTDGRAVRIPAEFEAKEVPFFKLKVDMALISRKLVKGRKGKMVMHLTKSLGTFQFGDRPWDLEMVGWYGRTEERLFPENGPFSPVPSAKKIAEWREEVDRSGSIPQRTSKDRRKRITILEEEKERLQTEITRLEKLLREAEESREYLLAQIKELRIENAYLRRGEIPLEPVEGGAKAVLWGKAFIIRDGLILEADENGGKPIGRYDRETGIGLIESLPVRLRRNGRGWLLVV